MEANQVRLIDKHNLINNHINNSIPESCTNINQSGIEPLGAPEIQLESGVGTTVEERTNPCIRIH